MTAFRSIVVRRPLVRVVFGLAPLVALAAACEPPPAPPATGASLPSSSVAPTTAPPVCPAHIAHRAAPRTPPPAGWVGIAAPSSGSETLTCANLSRSEWDVRAATDGTRIAPRSTRDDELPVAFTPPARGLGRRRVLAVDGGYLVGFEDGAGASLVFVPASGPSRVLESGAWVGFATLRTGLVAVLERTGGSMRSAAAYHVARDPSGAYHATRWVDLGGGVDAVTTESPESMLVLSTTGLDRLTACGDLSRIGSTRYDVLYPSSLAVDPSGIVYVGMRHFVTRWVPVASGGYEEEWLTRSGCALLSNQKFECVCRG